MLSLPKYSLSSEIIHSICSEVATTRSCFALRSIQARYCKFVTYNPFWHDCPSSSNNKSSINRYIGKLVYQKKALSRPNDKTNPLVNGPYPTGDTLKKTKSVLMNGINIYNSLEPRGFKKGDAKFCVATGFSKRDFSFL